jgi:adenine-specific DNA methylase
MFKWIKRFKDSIRESRREKEKEMQRQKEEDQFYGSVVENLTKLTKANKIPWRKDGVAEVEGVEIRVRSFYIDIGLWRSSFHREFEPGRELYRAVEDYLWRIRNEEEKKDLEGAKAIAALKL